MSIFRPLLLPILILFSTLVLFSAHAKAFDLFGNACSGNGANSPACQEKNSTGSSNEDNKISGPHGIINRAASIIAIVAGIVAVIMIIISGLSYITAGSNADQAAKARQRLLYSVIGLAIVAAAWVIVTFLTSHLVNT